MTFIVKMAMTGIQAYSEFKSLMNSSVEMVMIGMPTPCSKSLANDKCGLIYHGINCDRASSHLSVIFSARMLVIQTESAQKRVD